MTLARLITGLFEVLAGTDCEPDDERRLSDGAEGLGDMNFRTNRFDCGTDAGGFYEDDL